MFEPLFFGKTPASLASYQTSISACLRVLAEALPTRSYEGGSPAQLAQKLPEWHEQGGSWETALADLHSVVATSIAVYHPYTCAHLHCPVLVPALCAELVLTALNPSMDSFDQSAAATLIEQQVCDWIIRLVGSAGNPAAIFTTGGTQSNYLGLLLARDRLIDRRWQWSVQQDGLPPQAIGRLKILCSESAHFSVVKAAHQLGLGSTAVITVPVDTEARMRPDELRRLLDEQAAMGHEIIAVVATAGTTDAGAFDPIPQIQEICQQHQIWLHVDAAWGGAVLVSTQHRSKLQGVELADSVALDFHKGFYQPISCSAIVVRDDANFEFIRHHSDYLNPVEHEELGVPDLVTRSLLTTRRFDSLKLWFSLRVCGANTLGAMVDQTISLAAAVGAELAQSEYFELCCIPEFSSILFRLRPTAGETTAELEAIHAYLPTHLLHTGRGIIGFSKWQDQRCLKLTLLNPCTEKGDISALLDIIFTAAVEYRRTTQRPF